VFAVEINEMQLTGVSVFKVYQCSFPEPYGSGFWFVFFGVIVPITPHTQNIMPSQNLLGVLREVEF